jgi:hypothetical protein
LVVKIARLLRCGSLRGIGRDHRAKPAGNQAKRNAGHGQSGQRQKERRLHNPAPLARLERQELLQSSHDAAASGTG